MSREYHKKISTVSTAIIIHFIINKKDIKGKNKEIF